MSDDNSSYHFSIGKPLAWLRLFPAISSEEVIA